MLIGVWMRVARMVVWPALVVMTGRGVNVCAIAVEQSPAKPITHPATIQRAAVSRATEPEEYMAGLYAPTPRAPRLIVE